MATNTMPICDTKRQFLFLRDNLQKKLSDIKKEPNENGTSVAHDEAVLIEALVLVTKILDAHDERANCSCFRSGPHRETQSCTHTSIDVNRLRELLANFQCHAAESQLFLQECQLSDCNKIVQNSVLNPNSSCFVPRNFVAEDKCTSSKPTREKNSVEAANLDAHLLEDFKCLWEDERKAPSPPRTKYPLLLGCIYIPSCYPPATVAILAHTARTSKLATIWSVSARDTKIWNKQLLDARSGTSGFGYAVVSEDAERQCEEQSVNGYSNEMPDDDSFKEMGNSCKLSKDPIDVSSCAGESKQARNSKYSLSHLRLIIQTLERKRALGLSPFRDASTQFRFCESLLEQAPECELPCSVWCEPKVPMKEITRSSIIKKEMVVKRQLDNARNLVRTAKLVMNQGHRTTLILKNSQSQKVSSDGNLTSNVRSRKRSVDSGYNSLKGFASKDPPVLIESEKTSADDKFCTLYNTDIWTPLPQYYPQSKGEYDNHTNVKHRNIQGGRPRMKENRKM